MSGCFNGALDTSRCRTGNVGLCDSNFVTSPIELTAVVCCPTNTKYVPSPEIGNICENKERNTKFIAHSDTDALRAQ